MQDETILSQIKETEQKFKVNNYKGHSNGLSFMVEKYGDVPILLSALHAVKQIRNGEIMPSHLMWQIHMLRKKHLLLV